MPRASKSRTSPDASVDNPKVRTKVKRACDRCRLKKRKCNGATPCNQCKGDNAICAYEKHKKSDKKVYQPGEVQMLVRQHAQLTAGLQELYRRMQQGEGWTGPSVELGRNNQPLTHKILEALGVLHPDDVHSDWKGSENQGQDDDGWMYSETCSPSTHTVMSPDSPTQSAFPQSTIMRQSRRSELPTDLTPNGPSAQTLSMPPPFMTDLALIQPEPYHHAFPAPMATLSDAFGPNEQMAWSHGLDLMSNLSGQEQAVHGWQAPRETEWN